MDNCTWKLRAVRINEGTYFQVYPIAFGFDDLKNNLSWEWFLDSWRGALGHIDDLVFISDQQARIEAVIS
ncbi:hypothetical protein Ddye_023227 [Dipteronia dyeriana]|uniref:Uncharacterized protein n=1 Tax=Dipteronia dyeriana TaxID=168575 RepID=A0AAD9TTH8_9ROSI|nr:hypothetical protein Ddye_023227 [Dipteronia dyeriana]